MMAVASRMEYLAALEIFNKPQQCTRDFIRQLWQDRGLRNRAIDLARARNKIMIYANSMAPVQTRATESLRMVQDK